MNNAVKNDYFKFLKVQWLHLRDEMDKPVLFSCEMYSGYNVPKVIKIG